MLKYGFEFFICSSLKQLSLQKLCIKVEVIDAVKAEAHMSSMRPLVSFPLVISP